jgi:spore maturation protein CgeB
VSCHCKRAAPRDVPAAQRMTPLDILYIGPRSGTCLDRACALVRLGHRLHHVDIRGLLPSSGWIDRIIWKLGGQWFEPWVNRILTGALGDRRYDLAYVDNGELVSAGVIRRLRRHAPMVINYNIDDPLGSRDGAKWGAYRRSLPFYDLCVVMRPINVQEARARGAKEVMVAHRSADEFTHSPLKLDSEDYARWNSEVLFLGTWFPERGPFLVNLVERHVPLSIRGANWHKAPEWDRLREFWKGDHLSGADYTKAIQCARVNIGLLSKGNRDLHTTRSLEIPAIGGLLCAERTSEHLEMYEEGKEALFWNDAAECAAMCRFALQDEVRRREIAAAGRARVRANGHYNEVIMASIIERCLVLKHVP